MELDRAIRVLKRGLQEEWETRDQYLSAFVKTPSTDATGLSVADAKKYVECAIGADLRIHQIWDEGVPIESEVRRTIIEFTKLRNDAAQATTDTVFHPPFCPGLTSQRATVSAGVAAGLLKTRVDPVYPAEALKKHVSGTVVLHARISTKGRVEALRVITGPALLQEAALDAIRQWTYSPYLLNNMPVEVETTINVAFAPSR
jgi:TonB family protein